MSEISFVSEFLHPTDSGSYYADILVVDSKDGLFEELNSKLAFPYFGFNWDALWDLYCDFHWIEQRYIYISSRRYANAFSRVVSISWYRC